MDCIFCSIAGKKLPSNMVFEDEAMVVFHDIHPKAKLHLLVVPKRHIPSLVETAEEDAGLLGALLLRARLIAAELGISEGGYKVVINTGSDGGQIIPHLHLHLLGGEPVRSLV